MLVDPPVTIAVFPASFFDILSPHQTIVVMAYPFNNVAIGVFSYLSLSTGYGEKHVQHIRTSAPGMRFCSGNRLAARAICIRIRSPSTTIEMERCCRPKDVSEFQCVFTAARNEHVIHPFLNEALRAGETHTCRRS